MSPREGINLLCTNRGIISPMRVCVCVCVCVRAGGVAAGPSYCIKDAVVCVCVRAGGLP